MFLELDPQQRRDQETRKEEEHRNAEPAGDDVAEAGVPGEDDGERHGANPIERWDIELPRGRGACLGPGRRRRRVHR